MVRDSLPGIEADPDLQRLFYGGEIAPEAEALLRKAAGAWQRTEEAQGYLEEAVSRWPSEVPVLIACYKFFFYKGMLSKALVHAYTLKGQSARRMGFPEDFREVRAHHANFDDYDKDPRFYLFTLKAIGYILLRLKRFDEGKEYVSKVLELDPGDKMGASILMRLILAGAPED